MKCVCPVTLLVTESSAGMHAMSMGACSDTFSFAASFTKALKTKRRPFNGRNTDIHLLL